MARLPGRTAVARADSPWRSLLYVTLAYGVFYALPVAGYMLLAEAHYRALIVLHYVMASAYTITAFVILFEAWKSVPRRHAPVSHDDALERAPHVTAVVSAYLPNEQDIVLDTIVHLRSRCRIPSHRLQIILAYNTPEDLAVEDRLRELQRIDPHFLPLRVPGSRSKAENIVAALDHTEGEVTALLDADHHPHPEAFQRACRWLQLGYDAVQGRSVIRSQQRSFFTRYMAVEFEHMYSVMHTGRSLAIDTAIFGGSNGYWRTAVLRDVLLDSRMLTEDIDTTVRAILAGRQIVHDRSVISTELGVPNFRRWWSQRLRWAQGWLQVTFRHQGAIWRSTHLPFKTKAQWTFLLFWGQLFPVLALQVFALLTAAWTSGRSIEWLGHPYLVATAVFTVLAGALSSLATYRVALWRTKERLRPWFWIYALTNLPYVTLKNTVSLVATLREMFHDNHWVVTPRGE